MSQDMTILFQELNVLAQRHGIGVDRARHYRWAAWGALVNGRRWDALRYYTGAIAAGDLPSIGRAAIALLRPIGTVKTRYKRGDPWSAEATLWLDDLR